MGKTLIITEKPSVARAIAVALGCGTKGKGVISGGQYIISWAVGHLAGLYDPEDYSPQYKRWDIKHLPIIPEQFKLKLNPKTLEQHKILNSLINSTEVDELICATDPAREGELIFRYIYILSGTKKPFKRLWLKSTTTEAIEKAFLNLKDGKDYNNLYNAGYARNSADWLVGVNATRAFSLIHGETLSIGRVQTPTLEMIVRRELEIQNFKSTTYYTIKGNFKGKEAFTAIYQLEDGETQIEDERTAQSILQSIQNQKRWRVKEILEDDFSESPPELYNLSELQKDCNRLYGFSAEKTLQIAQELYEKSCISYPRTDSRYLTKDMVADIDKMMRLLRKVNQYAQLIEKINSLNLKNTVDDSLVTDHHAIIPQTMPQTLSEDEWKVYDLIARRFIVAFMPDCLYRKLSASIINNDIKGMFVVSWTKTMSRGWKNEREEKDLKLEQGDFLTLHSVNMEENITKPPYRYTDGTLIGALEGAGRFVNDGELKNQLKQKGLGTSATRASIIEKLIKIGYIVREFDGEREVLKPTVKGLNIIDYLDIFPDMKSVALTAKWEQVLGDIEQGTATNQEFIFEIKKFVCSLVNHCENVLRGKKDEQRKDSGDTKQA